MKRLWVIILSVFMLATGWALGAQQGFSMSGRIGATDQEAQEGYFAIGPETMIVVKPNSALHTYLRSKVGQQVTVTIEPQAGS